MEVIQFQTMVRHRLSGQLGVVVSDDFALCTPDQTVVVWEGHDAHQSVSTAELEVIGPENARADRVKCGAGQGERCCIFFTAKFPSGPLECARFGSLRTSLIFRAARGGMVAQRHPTQLYPSCQLS